VVSFLMSATGVRVVLSFPVMASWDLSSPFPVSGLLGLFASRLLWEVSVPLLPWSRGLHLEPDAIGRSGGAVWQIGFKT